MRGSPPIHLLLFSLAFLLLAIPLSRLTFGRKETFTPATIEAPSESPEAVNALLRLRFSHPPQTLVVRPLSPGEAAILHLNANASSPVEQNVPLLLDDHTLELSIEATWPDHTPDAAITLELEPDGLDQQSRTVWSSGRSISEILTFQWRP
jgi:hypothetical protein